jgi:predicted ABC-type ATPase
MNETPRLRMFAGANGSGKSTLKSVINPALLGVYINPDDIEREIKAQGFLDFSAYQVTTNTDEVLSFFTNSSFLKSAGLLDDSMKLTFDESKLIFTNIEVNSYFASVASDFIRHKLLESSISFTFETVMSSPDIANAS